MSRNDSTDKFYKETIPFLCDPETGVPDACDAILDQICYPYTYDEVLNSKDGTLLALCGCHLSDGTQTAQQVHDNGGIDMPVNPHDMPNQYTNNPGATPLVECDPLCLNPDTIPRKQPCTLTICEISGIQVNIINSKIEAGEAVNISQFCGCQEGADADGEKCSGRCALQGIDISILDSWAKASEKGLINFGEHCGSCYIMNKPNDWDPTNLKAIDCKTFKEITDCTISGCPCDKYTQCNQQTKKCIPKYKCSPECPSNFVCSDEKQCIPLCSCTGCTGGQKCNLQTGACQEAPGGCTNDGQCGAGLKCVGGKCVSKRNGGESWIDQNKWYIIWSVVGLILFILLFFFIRWLVKRHRRKSII
jgi:hypothetical protein